MRAAWFAPIALVVALSGCGKARKEPPPTLVWYSLHEGEARAKTEHRLALVFFEAEWDTAAKEYHHETFPDPEVREALRDWVLIRVDITDEEQPTVQAAKERFKVVGDPTLILIDFDDPEEGELRRFNEYMQPRRMTSVLYAATAKARSLRAGEH